MRRNTCMMGMQNTFPELELRGTELFFNTFIFVQFISIIIILHSVKDFFFHTTQDAFFAVIFISLSAF